MAERVTVLVSNDLVVDQRVEKTCAFLLDSGYSVELIGRRLPSSPSLDRPYPVRRFRLLFHRGALFYASLNIRLFIYLLFARMDIIHANDLDTLLPAFLVSRLRRKRLVYDSHEYFTEAEGLTGRPFQKKVWMLIEQFILPRIGSMVTVNESIATIYRERYSIDVRVVRNVPVRRTWPTPPPRKELGIPEDKKMLILQGAFIDPDRGGLEAVEAMKWLEGAHLFVIGAGRDLPRLQAISKAEGLSEKVTFLPRMPYERLREYTAHADLGLSLDKPVHLNYRYSLPNKLFDYLHAGVPVLVSDLVEPRRIVETYGVGSVVKELAPQAIADAIRKALAHADYPIWKVNAVRASDELNWQKECAVWRGFYPGC